MSFNLVIPATHYWYSHARCSRNKYIFKHVLSQLPTRTTPHPTPLPLPLLQRRNARIKSHKLPPDFFTLHHQRTIGTDLSNRNIHTPSFPNRPSPPLLTLDLPRKAETAREQADLTLPETPQTSRVLRPALRPRSLRRKQSLSCGREVSASLDEKYLRLPKILNKALMRYL